MLPLIGISTSELRTPPHVDPLEDSDPPRLELALGLDYPRSMDAAGAVPVVIPPMTITEIEALLDRIDGLLLPGGPDVHPSAYGAEPHPELGPTEPELDAFEIELVQRADARRMPILAICRGLQVVNVARGGSLVQHLPDVTDGTIEHRQREPGIVATHPVWIEPDSALARHLGDVGPAVNSFHHQAVDRIGRELQPVAWAPDGVVEGLEATDHPFLVAVQWHGESHHRRDDHDRLFGAFVAAAARFEPARRAAA